MTVYAWTDDVEAAMERRRACGNDNRTIRLLVFSRIATSVRPTARPEPFKVWTKSGFACPCGRYLMFARRAWNASVLLQDEISRYVF
jgi:hypothetical protein